MVVKKKKGKSGRANRKVSKKVVIAKKDTVELIDKGDVDLENRNVMEPLDSCKYLCPGDCGCLGSGCKAPCKK
jgi:hypothetical protein